MPWTPLIVMAETDWAYVAGFLDGEGCLGIGLRSRKHSGSRQITTKPSFFVRVSAVNTHRPVLEWLALHLGGTITPKKIVANQKQVWVWRLANTEACQTVVRRCLPYLKIKREHALLILQFPAYAKINQWTKDTSMVTDTKIALYQRTRELNRRGGEHSLGSV